ncbi:MAG: 30S ribosomal protein S2 [Flavobacteriales bacterium]
MAKVNIQELLDNGVHFGHLTRKWNPNMAPYIYTERNGVHIIDLYKTAAKIEETSEALNKIANSGRKILFVATKKQAKDIVAEKAKAINMPYITERWPGGMLTNFVTIRKAVKKMALIDRMKTDGSFDALSKREKLQINRQREKLEKNLGSISDMTRLPGALFIVDIKKEHIAVAEAQKLNIPIFAMVDTNSDPRQVDYVIPANDDASKSIDKVLSFVTDAVAEGLSDRKADKEKVKETKEVAAPETEEVAPKAEETKEVAPKKKEAKAKAPKAKAVKAKETKVKETKVKETKVEETKVEETKVEEIKAEDTETPAEEKK